MTHLLVIKLLPTHSRGDLAIAKGMLEKIKNLCPELKISILCRDIKLDKKHFSKYGAVFLSDF